MMSANMNSKSQGFKKKNLTISTNENNPKTQDKFGDLKSKLQKEKQMMRKTGKRFRQDTSMSTQEVSIDTNTDKIQVKNALPQKHEICIGSQQPIKQTISLKEISPDAYESTGSSLQSSQLFQKEIQHQKKKSKQIHDFLKILELENFAQALIQNGFDDLQTLAEVSTQDLNMVMMRAPQQIKLLQAIKAKNLKIGDGLHRDIIKQQNASTLWRMKTEPMQQSKPPRVQSSQIISQLKTQHKKQQQGHTGLKPGSFLYSVGSKNWSVEDQIRRACSVCFKVEQQMQKKGECFYCSNCYKYVSEDLLQLEIGKNLGRSYKKLEEQ